MLRCNLGRIRLSRRTVQLAFSASIVCLSVQGGTFKTIPVLYRDFLVDAGLANNGYTPFGEAYHLSVAWHLVPSSTEPAPDAAIVGEIEQALGAFQSHGIFFHTVDVISHAGPLGDVCDSVLELGSSEAPGTRLDVFLRPPSAGGSACFMPPPLRCGAGVGPISLTPFQKSVVLHEMGHALGLLHTHEGSQAALPDTTPPLGGVCPPDPDPNDPEIEGGESWNRDEGEPYEVEPYACGDAVADTPFHLGVSFSEGFGGEVDPATCYWTSPGDPIWAARNAAGTPSAQLRLASPTNLMHYSNYACQSTFSAGQSRRMKVAIESGKWPLASEWLGGVGPPWGTGGSVPSPDRYLYHGALYPYESIQASLPPDAGAWFLGESFTLGWTQTYASVAGYPIIEQVEVTVVDSELVTIHASGPIPNAPPYTAWGPGTSELGEVLTVQVEFTNKYSPYSHTNELTFSVEDILSRQEVVIAPNSASDLHAGPIVIEWTTENSYRGAPPSSELMLDQVDIYLSRDEGQTFPETLVLGEPNDGGYVWTPVAGDYCPTARIRIVWHNIVNSSTVQDDSEPFSFGGSPFEMVNRSDETGLAAQVSGAIAAAQPYAVVAFPYTAQVPDVLVSHLNIATQLYEATTLDATGAPQFHPRRDLAFLSHLADAPLDQHRGLAAGNFDSNADLWSSIGGDSGQDLFLARETGARVYRNLGLNGELYPQYQDVISPYFGGPSLFNGSWCGQWADVNADGLVDLIVGRATLPSGGSGADLPSAEALEPATLRLFVQRDESHPQRPGFDEVAVARGLTTAAATIALLVVDLDGDGAPEIVQGDLRTSARSGQTRIYSNDGAGNFTVQSEFSAGVEPTSVSGLAAADLDRDGMLDVAVARQSPAGELPPLVYRNLGSLAFAAAVELDVAISQSAVTVFDHDANQTLDLLFLPESQSESAHYLGNFSTPGFLAFVDRTTAVGLDAAGTARGVASADFDGDGRTDLYLGRTLAGGHFFYRAEKPQPIPDEPRHIAVALEGGDGGNVQSGEGAVVTLLRNGEPLSSQHYALPSGGSQSTQPVLFAVPDDGASYSIETRWAEGFVQTQPATVSALNTVQDATSPELQHATMLASYTPGPGGTMTMSFAWDCNNQALHSLDRVHMTSTAGCLSEELVFAPGDPNVTMQCIRNTDGSERHELIVNGLSCIPQCVYTWWCESSTSFVSSDSSSNPKTIKTKICVQ